MQNKPLISIVTVCLNNAAELEKTINSVLEQDYKNIDYIIIDGGSVDTTIDVIYKYKEDISYWISEKDEGIYDAMNKGILKSSGKLINFLNAGDCYYDNSILSMVSENFEKFKDTGIIYGLSGNFSLKENIKYISGSKISESHLWKGMPICHQSMFFNKKVFEDIGSYDLRYKNMADHEFLLRFIKSEIKNEYKLLFINKPLSKFILFGESDKNYLKNLNEIISISKKYFNFDFKKILYFKIKYFKYYILVLMKIFGINKLYRRLKYNLFFRIRH